MFPCREASRDTPTSIRLASHSATERLTPELKNMSSNLLYGRNSVHWLKWKDPLGQVFLHLHFLKKVQNRGILLHICECAKTNTHQEDEKNSELQLR
jgi:hypothetical protein